MFCSWSVHSEVPLHSPLFQNLNQNPRTLLPKFFGLYCVQSGGKNIRVVVMNNVLPRVVRMHLKYDLKGSTYKRRASKKEREKARPTFKDLDFMQDIPDGLMLDQDTYNALVKTLQRDCLVSMTAAWIHMCLFSLKKTVIDFWFSLFKKFTTKVVYRLYKVSSLKPNWIYNNTYKPIW